VFQTPANEMFDGLETPFSELVVAGCGLVASRQSAAEPYARPHGHFDGHLVLTEPVLFERYPDISMTIASEWRNPDLEDAARAGPGGIVIRPEDKIRPKAW
jgi:hypothetical protein